MQVNSLILVAKLANKMSNELIIQLPIISRNLIKTYLVVLYAIGDERETFPVSNTDSALRASDLCFLSNFYLIMMFFIRNMLDRDIISDQQITCFLI
jgi:hypothetical protein